MQRPHFVQHVDPDLGEYFLYTDLELGGSEQGQGAVRVSASLPSIKPVYVVFSERGVEFFFHGFVCSSAGSRTRGDVHERILFLPASSRLSHRDRLSERVLSAGTEQWKVFEPEGLLTAHGYSSLASCWPSQQRHETDSEGRGEVLLQRLLLDFLFALEHEKEFLKSPHIDDVDALVRESPLLSGIHHKAEYFWQRREAQRFFRQIEERPDDWIHLREMLRDAETDWLDICTAPDATEQLRPGPSRGWFWELEDEVKCVALLDLTVKEPFSGMTANWSNIRTAVRWLDGRPTEKSRDEERSLKRSTRLATWFLRRYDLDTAFWCIIPRINWISWTFGALDPPRRWESGGGSEIRQGDRESEPRKPKGGRVNPDSAHEPDQANRNHMKAKNRRSLLAVLPYLVFAVLLGMPMMSTPLVPWSTIIWRLFAVAIPIGVGIAAACWPRSENRSLQVPMRMMTHVSVLFVFGTLWVLVLDYCGVFPAARGPLIALYLIALLALVIIFVTGMIVVAGVLVRFINNPRCEGVLRRRVARVLLLMRLFLPRVLFATTAAWVVLANSEEIGVNAIVTTPFELVLVFLFMMSIAYLFATVEINNTILDSSAAAVRSLTVVGLSFGAALLIGVVMTNLAMRGLILGSEALLSEPTISRVKQLPAGATFDQLESLCFTNAEIVAMNESVRRELGIADVPAGPANDVYRRADGLLLVNAERAGRTLPWMAAADAQKNAGWWCAESEVRFWLLQQVKWSAGRSEATSYDSGEVDPRGISLLYVYTLPIFPYWVMVMPAALLKLSFVAVFTALFLQLVFEDKAMTEPL